MKTSTSIAALASALAKAQGELAGAKKDAKNPAFNSTYADLPSVIDALKAALPKHGLSYAQFPVTSEKDECGIETLLMHESGEWLQSEPFFIPVAKANAHGFGSALTYARRYALASVCGLKADDDDGNAAAAAPAKKFHHPASDTARVEYEALPPDAQQVVREWALEVVGLVTAGAVRDAVEFIELNCVTQEDKLAIWSLLDSKTRSAIKKAKNQAAELSTQA